MDTAPFPFLRTRLNDKIQSETIDVILVKSIDG